MHESKNCPRCGKQFECKAGNITQCQCYGISLSEEAKQLVAERYVDCLCRDCLLALKDQVKLFQEKFRS